MLLPKHTESFNPAPEFFDEPIKGKKNFRSLASDENLIKERFERQMNLYLAPRVKKNKINMTAD